jgi:retron-type reverse transcriptase
MKGGALSHYEEDKAKEKARAKLESLKTARSSQMKRYWVAYNKLSSQLGLDEILEKFCRNRDSVMYSNWRNNGSYFLSDDNVRRVFNELISSIRVEDERINRPSFAKNFG